MKLFFVTLVLALLLAHAALACAPGWHCKPSPRGAAFETAARGSHQILRGEYDAIEEISVAELGMKFANVPFLAVDTSAEMIHLDAAGFDALTDTLVPGEMVEVALADGGEVLAFRVLDIPVADRRRGVHFEHNDLSTMTEATYGFNHSTVMRVYVTEVNFGAAGPPCPGGVPSLLNSATGSVRHTYETVSSNTITVSYTYHPSTIDIGTQNNCDYPSWVAAMDAAINWVAIQSAYDYRWYFLPQGTCAWAGLAHVSPSCTNCWALNNNCGSMVATHEGGHNQGLHHSGRVATYDDHSDYMGNANGFRGLNAVKKLEMGLVRPENIVFDAGYGLHRLYTLDGDYMSATEKQVLLLQSSNSHVVALRSLAHPSMSLPTTYRDKVNVHMDQPSSSSVFRGAAGVGDPQVPAGSMGVRTISIEMDGSGNAEYAYVAVCRSTSGLCPEYTFVPECNDDGSAAVLGCALDEYYPAEHWMCNVTNAASLDPSLLGPGLACRVLSGPPPSDDAGGDGDGDGDGTSNAGAIAGGTIGAIAGGALLCCVCLALMAALVLVVIVLVVVVAVVAIVVALLVVGISGGGIAVVKSRDGSSYNPSVYEDKAAFTAASAHPTVAPVAVAPPPAQLAPAPASAPRPRMGPQMGPPGRRMPPVPARRGGAPPAPAPRGTKPMPAPGSMARKPLPAPGSMAQRRATPQARPLPVPGRGPPQRPGRY